MSPFGLDALAIPFMAIFLLTLVASIRITGNPALSIFLALCKAALFVAYFGWVFDGTYTFLDDWTYVDGGRELLRRGIGVSNLAENWQYVLMIGGGDHFAYYLYNTYAFRLFGDAYFAPVALNVIATVIAAHLGTRLAATEFNLAGMGQKLFFVFLLLHPDILAWSNVMNGKDLLLLLFHVFLLLSVSLYMRGRVLQALMLAAPVVLVLFFLRFYVPVLFAVALSASVLTARSGGWKRIGYLLVATLLMATMLLWIGGAGIQYAIDQVRAAMVNPVFGFIRMLLTPVPFNTDEAYAFLNLPAALHWMLMPFAVFGAFSVWRQGSPFSRFFVTYVLVFMSLYAVFGELQGPRHRVQLDYAWAVFQFMGVKRFLETVLVSINARRREAQLTLSER